MSWFRQYSKIAIEVLQNMTCLFIRVDRCFSRFGNKPMLNQIKFNAWLQQLATGLRCCNLSTNVRDWAILNRSGSTIDRLKIIVKWGTFHPWRTLDHVTGGQGGHKTSIKLRRCCCLRKNGANQNFYLIFSMFTVQRCVGFQSLEYVGHEKRGTGRCFNKRKYLRLMKSVSSACEKVSWFPSSDLL